MQQDSLVEALRVALPTLVAVDGASRQGWAAWGIAWRSRGGLRHLAGAVTGPDCSSTSAELFAVSVLLAALVRLGAARSRICLLSDCRAVVDVLKYGKDLECQWRLTTRLRAVALDVGLITHWVPAHGRHRGWRNPSLPCSSSAARALNRSAHNACQRELSRQELIDAPRRLWLQEYDAARTWARVVLRAAADLQLCCALLWSQENPSAA